MRFPREAPIAWSVAASKLYGRCPRAWWYRYIGGWQGWKGGTGGLRARDLHALRGRRPESKAVEQAVRHAIQAALGRAAAGPDVETACAGLRAVLLAERPTISEATLGEAAACLRAFYAGPWLGWEPIHVAGRRPRFFAVDGARVWWVPDAAMVDSDGQIVVLDFRTPPWSPMHELAPAVHALGALEARWVPDAECLRSDRVFLVGDLILVGGLIGAEVETRWPSTEGVDEAVEAIGVELARFREGGRSEAGHAPTPGTHCAGCSFQSVCPAVMRGCGNGLG